MLTNSLTTGQIEAGVNEFLAATPSDDPDTVVKDIYTAMVAVDRPSSVDSVFAQIKRHKTLRHRVNTMPESDDDPVYQAASEAEEAAIQALGDMKPTSIAAAAAQLAYMAEVEGVFAVGGSPLLRTMLSVAEGLTSLHMADAA